MGWHVLDAVRQRTVEPGCGGDHGGVVPAAPQLTHVVDCDADGATESTLWRYQRHDVEDPHLVPSGVAFLLPASPPGRRSGREVVGAARTAEPSGTSRVATAC